MSLRMSFATSSWMLKTWAMLYRCELDGVKSYLILNVKNLGAVAWGSDAKPEGELMKAMTEQKAKACNVPDGGFKPQLVPCSDHPRGGTICTHNIREEASEPTSPLSQDPSGHCLLSHAAFACSENWCVVPMYSPVHFLFFFFFLFRIDTFKLTAPKFLTTGDGQSLNESSSWLCSHKMLNLKKPESCPL